MRFWDSSAIVPLINQEESTATMRALLGDDPAVIVWATTGLEVASALWRRARAGDLTEAARTAAAESLAQLAASWSTAIDVAEVVTRARRVLAAHPLRAADAAQLAAALVCCRERTDHLEFVTLDKRLADAARREGLRVLPG
ncbi:MAG: type II toxin-antitoxin system VapC family toxin [Planctomycetes bacterium]|nr:type II toxin-antitoxin system VapC family toxin [Planctomycetota bacterium]